ncbi:MAG: hypothetical protein K6G17_03325 [Oscillospiraceae bacterium]|nr:hypothetical protein [Oscillospiraceae bacterium]
MVGWIILGVIVLIIIGINLISVGADVAYEGGQLRLAAKVIGIEIQLLPKKESDEPKPKKEKKEKKPKKKKKPKEEKKEPAEKEKGLPLGLSVEELLELAKKALGRLARFPRKICIDRFLLHYTAAGDDPYNTARTFGTVNEVLSVLLPLARSAFRVRKSDVRTDVDFTLDKMQLDFGLGLHFRIGQLVGTLFSTAFAALGVIVRSKIRQKKEKKALGKQGNNSPTETENSETEAAQAEERMESNG